MSRQWQNKLHMGGYFNIWQDCGRMGAYKEAKYDHLTFNLDNYDSKEAMWKDVTKLQMTLLRNGNMVRIRQEEELVIVEWTHDNNREYYGGTHLEFLTEDEIDLIECYRSEDANTIKENLKPEEIADEN